MARDFILLDGDLQIANGDFVTGESDQQHVEELLIAQPGEFKQTPVLGIGISNYLKAPMSPRVIEELERKIKLQLAADGATKVKLSVQSMEDVKIEAIYP